MTQYKEMSWRHALGLAAPHTWAASVLPAFLGAVLSFVLKGKWDTVFFGCLLLICVLMQSAVNTFNDYCDFIKETDTVENCSDPADAVLIYNLLDPGKVLFLGFVFLMAAGLLGAWVTMRAGLVLLAIGAFGGLIVLLYSFGRPPISYLPLGELMSGFVMGGLIPLAVYSAICGETDFTVILYALPIMIGIALIMYTNNTSDIERDIIAGRKTLPMLLGRSRARILYGIALTVWILCIGCIVLGWFSGSAALLLLFLPCAFFAVVKQLRYPLTPGTRGGAMSGILRLNLLLGVGYMAMILLHGFRFLSGRQI